jgi:hypothetical protein
MLSSDEKYGTTLSMPLLLVHVKLEIVFRISFSSEGLSSSCILMLESVITVVCSDSPSELQDRFEK